jgi:hypothetical protein
VVGFEPTEVSLSGFQDRCTKPDYATLPSGMMFIPYGVEPPPFLFSLDDQSNEHCSPNRTRTYNHPVNSRKLCQLSYGRLDGFSLLFIGNLARRKFPGTSQRTVRKQDTKYRLKEKLLASIWLLSNYSSIIILVISPHITGT